MRIDEFIEYKRRVEQGFVDDDETQRIYEWMERTERLDESFFGAIWRWLKKNFSSTSRKIYKLADEYEVELREELRAEWGNIKDKSLASKFRRGTWMKLSRDIEDRIDIIVGDDADYRELARTIINKKTVKVKKELLIELSSELDPDFVRETEKGMDEELDNLSVEEKRILKKEMGDVDYSTLSTFLKRKISSNPRIFYKILIKTSKDISNFIAMIIIYVNKLSSINKNIRLNEKTVYKYAKEYVAIVDKILENIRSKYEHIDNNTIIIIIKRALDSLIRGDKPKDFDRIAEDATRIAIDFLDNYSDDIDIDDFKSPIVTDRSKKVVDDSDMNAAVDTAKNRSKKNKPTIEDIAEIIDKSVNSFFEKQIGNITDQLKEDIEDFNSRSESDRKVFKNKYRLNKDGKLDVPSEEDVKHLISDFVKIAGKIAVYYAYTEKDVKKAITITLEFVFAIYAIKKDIDDKLSDNDIDNIFKIITERKE